MRSGRSARRQAREPPLDRLDRVDRFDRLDRSQVRTLAGVCAAAVSSAWQRPQLRGVDHRPFETMPHAVAVQLENTVMAAERGARVSACVGDELFANPAMTDSLPRYRHINVTMVKSLSDMPTEHVHAVSVRHDDLHADQIAAVFEPLIDPTSPAFEPAGQEASLRSSPPATATTACAATTSISPSFQSARRRSPSSHSTRPDAVSPRRARRSSICSRELRGRWHRMPANEARASRSSAGSGSACSLPG